jgi:hypothetical protein
LFLVCPEWVQWVQWRRGSKIPLIPSFLGFLFLFRGDGIPKEKNWGRREWEECE